VRVSEVVRSGNTIRNQVFALEKVKHGKLELSLSYRKV
jgi:hypothetical protein